MQRQQPAIGCASSSCVKSNFYNKSLPLYHSEQLYLSDQTLADTSLFPGSPGYSVLGHVTAPKTFVHVIRQSHCQSKKKPRIGEAFILFLFPSPQDCGVVFRGWARSDLTVDQI